MTSEVTAAGIEQQADEGPGVDNRGSDREEIPDLETPDAGKPDALGSRRGSVVKEAAGGNAINQRLTAMWKRQRKEADGTPTVGDKRKDPPTSPGEIGLAVASQKKNPKKKRRKRKDSDSESSDAEPSDEQSAQAKAKAALTESSTRYENIGGMDSVKNSWFTIADRQGLGLSMTPMPH